MGYEKKKLLTSLAPVYSLIKLPSLRIPFLALAFFVYLTSPASALITIGAGATFTMAGAAALTTNDSLTVDGTLISGGPITGAATKTFTVSNGGLFEMNGTATYPTAFTTFTYGATSTVTYKQTNGMTIAAATYGHLELKPAGATPLVLPAGTYTIAGNYTIGNGTNAGATASANDPNITVGGVLTTAAASTYSAGAGTLTLTGSGNVMIMGGTTWSIDAGNTVRYWGSSATTVRGAIPYYNLEIGTNTPDGNAVTYTLGNNISGGPGPVQNTVTIGNAANAATDTFDLSDKIMDLAGSGTPLINTVRGNLAASTSTVNYVYTAASPVGVNVTRGTYYNLTVGAVASDTNPAVTYTFATGASDVLGSLTVGHASSTNADILNLITNDALLDVNNDVTITARGTLVADGNQLLTVGGAWTMNTGGAFTHSNGTVTFNADGTATSKVIGGTAGTTFYTLTVDAGTDIMTLGVNTTVNNALNITAGTFSQGASFNLTSSTTTTITVGASGIWSNLGTGDISIGSGGVSNSGSVILNSSNGSQCTDGANDIAITSTSTPTQRLWSSSGGTYTLINLAVTDMTNGSITAYHSTYTNTTWATGGGTCALVAGRIYTDEGTTGLDCTTTRTVAVRVNGTGSYTAECSNSPSIGSFSVPNVAFSAGNVITVFLNDETENAVTVTRAASSTDITGLPLYQDKVIVRNEDAGPITNTNLNVYDGNTGSCAGGTGDSDIGYCVTGTTLTTTAGNTLYIMASTTVFTPGGDITLNDSFKQVAGTFNPSGTVTVQPGGTSGTHKTWTYTGGTFNAGSSTIILKNSYLDIAGDHTWNNLTWGCTSYSEFHLTDNTDVTVTGTVDYNASNSCKQYGSAANTGILHIQGHITHTTNQIYNGGAPWGKVTIDGNATQNWTGDGVTNNGNSLPDITINKTGGSLNLSGNIHSAFWTYTAGTVNYGTSTMCFHGNETITGSQTFNNMFMDNNTGGTQGVTIAAGTTTTVAGTFTLDQTNETYSYGLWGSGTLIVQGNVSIDTKFDTASTRGITLTGGNTQTISVGGGLWNKGNLIINKTGGTTATLLTNLTLLNTFGGDVTVTAGIFDTGGFTLTGGGAGSILTVSNGATFRMSGASAYPTNFTGGFSYGATSTVKWNQNYSLATTDATYGNLELAPSANTITFTLPATVTAIPGNLILGNGTNTGDVITAATNDPTLSVTGTTTIAVGTTMTASDASSNVWTQTGDLTVNGTLNGGSLNTTITCAGHVTGTGVINITNVLAVFEMRAGTAKNFGTTSGTNDWTLGWLQINSSTGARTVTTQTGGSGKIIAGFLHVGKSGDTQITTLDPGNRTWELTDGPSVLVFQASSVLCPNSTCATNTSTFKITEGGAQVPASLGYYNLSLMPLNGTQISLLVGGTFTIANNLDIGDGTNNGASFSANVPINVTGTTTINANATVSNNLGTWTQTGPLIVNGILSGGQGGTAIIQSHVTGAGTINLSGGTFEVRGGSAANFGTTSTANAWTFNNLTFGSSTSRTVTTQTGGSGTITVSGILGIGKTGDGAPVTTLDPGNRTWILSRGAADAPLTYNGTSSVICPNSTCATNTSTFQYTGGIAGFIVTASAGYYNLSVIPSSSTAGILAAGTFTIANNFVVGNSTNAGATALANDPIIDVNNDFTISTSATFVASDAQDITVGGGWTNNGTFTNSSRTVTFNADGTATSKVIGGTAGTTFYTLTVDAGTDIMTLGVNTTVNNAFNITAGTFDQGASFNLTSSTTTTITVGASGIWSNLGTGDISIGSGGVSNAGTVTLNSGNLGSCVDGTNSIAITSTSTPTQRTWSGGGTYTLRNLSVTDQIGARASGNSTFTNSNWTDPCVACTGTTTGNWSVGSNWTSCTGAGGIPATTDIVFINPGVVITVNTGNPTVSSLTMASPTTANGLTVSTGQTLTVTNGFVYTANATANAQTVTLNGTGIVNAATLTVNAPTSTGNSVLACGGSTGAFNTTGASTLNGAATASGQVNFAITTCSFSSGGLLTMAGGSSGGNITLSTSTGNITASAGITFTGTAARDNLAISSTGTLNLTGTMSAGGTVTMAGGGTSTLVTTGTTAINGAYTWGKVTISSGTTTLGADQSVASDFTNNSAPGAWTGAFTTTMAAVHAMGGSSATTFNALTIFNNSIITANISFAVTNALTFAATGNTQSLTLGSAGVTATLNTVVMNAPSAAVNSTFDVAAGTANASGLITINGSATSSRNCRLIISTGTLGAAAGITFSGSSAQTLLMTSGAATINLTGTISAGGTVTMDATSNLACTGTSAINGAYTWGKLTVSSGTTTLGANLITTAQSTNAVNITGGTLNNGGFSITGNGATADTFSVSNGAFFEMAGTSAYPASFASYTYGASSTVRYLQTNGPTVTNATYGNLELKPAGATPIVLPATLNNMAGNFTIGDGTNQGATGDANDPSFTVGGVMTINAPGGEMYVTGSGTLTIAGSGTALSVGAPAAFTASTGSTVNFTGTSATSIDALASFYNLGVGTTSDGGTAVTYSLYNLGTTTVTNVLTVGNAGSTFIDILDGGSGNTIILSGSGTPFNITSKGSFTGNTSTVNYTGSSATNVAGATYNNLGIGTDNSGAAAGVTYTLGGDTTVTGTLTVGNGASVNTDTLNGSTFTLTLSLGDNSPVPFDITNKGLFVGASSTVNYTGSFSTVPIECNNATYFNLGLKPSGSFNQQICEMFGETLTVGGNLTIGDGSNSGGAQTQSGNNIIVNVTGTTTIAASSSLIARDVTWTQTGDMTITGTLSNQGTAGTITAAGSVTGAGQVNLNSQGTFEIRGGSAKNFGMTSGSNNWTFYDLTFGSTATRTVTTQTGGSGTITVSNILSVGKSGDGFVTTLDPGNKTWILTRNSSTPLVFNVSSVLCPNSSCATNTSTFQYTGTSGPTSTASAGYYNLKLSPLSSTAIVMGAGTYTITNLFTAGEPGNAGGATGATNNPTINTGTLTVQSAATFTTGTGTITISGTGTPLTLTGTLTVTSGNTIDYTGNGATITCTGASYYNLGLKPSAASQQPICTAGSQTLTVTNNLTVGNGTNNGATAATWNPIINVTGTTTIAAGATMTTGTGLWTQTGDMTITGILSGTANGTITAAGSVTGVGSINFSVAGTFEARGGTSTSFGTQSGVANWAFFNLTFGSTATRTVTTQTGGSGTITVSNILNVGKSGDGANVTTLNPGNRTWILPLISGTPLVFNASSVICPNSTCATNTSTFRYQGNGAGTIATASAGYYNLEIRPPGGTDIVMGAGTFTVTNLLTIGNGTNAGATAATNNPIINVTGTTTIAAGATMTIGTGAWTQTGNLIVDGTLSGAAIVTDTFAGSFTGIGVVNVTQATFEIRGGSAANFGTTSGANNWTLPALTFGSTATRTVTTQTGGSGTISFTTLNIGKIGDSFVTTLNPGNRTWLTSQIGSAIVFNASSVLCPNSTCPTNTSTFRFTGNGGTIGVSSGFYNLELKPSSSSPQVIGSAGGQTLTVTNSLTIGDGTNAGATAATNDPIINVTGTVTVAAGATFTLPAAATTFSSTTGISGTLSSDSGTTSLRTFTGAVTVNSGGTFNLTAGTFPTRFDGGITMSGTTFNTGTGATTFAATQALAGAGNMTFGGAATINNTFTLTNNNTGTVTFSSSIAGGGASGNFATGLNSYTNFASTVMGTAGATLTPTTSNHTVEYSGGAQTVKPPTTNNYYNLVLSGSGAKTLTSVNGTSGDLTLSGTATAATAATPFTITGTLALQSGTTFTAATTTNVLNAVSILGSSSAITLNVNSGITMTVTNNVTINAPTTAVNHLVAVGAGNLSAATFNVNGGASINMNSQLTVSTGTITSTGGINLSNAQSQLTTTGAATINLTGAITSGGTVTMNAASNLVSTGTSAINGAYTWGILTVNSGTLTLGANLITTAQSTNAVNITGGTLNNGGFSITGNGATADTFSVSNGAFFEMSGTSAYPASFTTYTYGVTSTVRYLQTAAATVVGGIYGHLGIGSISDGGTGVTYTLDGSVIVEVYGQLTVGHASSTFTDTLVASSMWLVLHNVGTGASRPFVVTSKGSFTATGGQVQFNGGGNVDIENVTYNILDLYGSGASHAYTFLGGFTAGTLGINQCGSGTMTVNLGGTTTISGTVGIDTDCGVATILDTTTSNHALTADNIVSGGEFKANGSTVTLTGSGSPFGVGVTFTPGASTVIYTGTTATNIKATTYNNLTINRASGTPTFTLVGNTTVSGALNITAGTFDQGASFNLISSTTTTITVGASGIWSNTGTGDISIGSGGVTNSGSIVLNSGNLGSCIDGTDDIVITSSSSPTQRTWGAGTYTLRNLNVTDQIGALAAGNSTFSNSNWTESCAVADTSGGFLTFF